MKRVNNGVRKSVTIWKRRCQQSPSIKGVTQQKISRKILFTTSVNCISDAILICLLTYVHILCRKKRRVSRYLYKIVIQSYQVCQQNRGVWLYLPLLTIELCWLTQRWACAPHRLNLDHLVCSSPHNLNIDHLVHLHND